MHRKSIIICTYYTGSQCPLQSYNWDIPSQASCRKRAIIIDDWLNINTLIIILSARHIIMLLITNPLLFIAPIHSVTALNPNNYIDPVANSIGAQTPLNIYLYRSRKGGGDHTSFWSPERIRERHTERYGTDRKLWCAIATTINDDDDNSKTRLTRACLSPCFRARANPPVARWCVHVNLTHIILLFLCI